MDSDKARVGTKVFYVLIEEAEIMAVSANRTHVMIKLHTGAQKGETIQVPLEDLKPIIK